MPDDPYLYCTNRIDVALAQGRDARRRGMNITSNFYPRKGKGCSYWGWWRRGWKDQDEEIERRRTPSRALKAQPPTPPKPKLPRRRNPRKRMLTPRDPNFQLRSNMRDKPMRDPTYDEMFDYLSDGLGRYAEDRRFDIEEAIYWFANDYHGGQWSNLYRALSASEFSPSQLASGPESPLLYDILVWEFRQ